MKFKLIVINNYYIGSSHFSLFIENGSTDNVRGTSISVETVDEVDVHSNGLTNRVA